MLDNDLEDKLFYGNKYINDNWKDCEIINEKDGVMIDSRCNIAVTSLIVALQNEWQIYILNSEKVVTFGGVTKRKATHAVNLGNIIGEVIIIEDVDGILISVEHFTARGYNVCFKEGSVELINARNNKVIYKGWQSSSTRLFYFDIKEIMKINYMEKDKYVSEIQIINYNTSFIGIIDEQLVQTENIIDINNILFNDDEINIELKADGNVSAVINYVIEKGVGFNKKCLKMKIII
jgi:hypothetical protein